MFKAKLIVEATGAVTSALLDTEYTGITTDSRTIMPGEVFVALKGEKFDGHTYCKKALEQGAGAVLVEKEVGTDRLRLF